MNNGLQDPELQKYHGEFKYSVSLFLDDITGNWTDYFIINEIGDMLDIFPLFYTDEIYSDGDNIVIDSPYKVTVPKGYKQILTFYGEDGQFIRPERQYTTSINNDFCSIRIEQADTGEILPNQRYVVTYPNFPDEQHITGKNGYGSFKIRESRYRIELL